ncbi:unnamed protein product [Adineta steineri]|uniref:Cation efflux protein cytoplasmic domain-containing protein n=1 Tax=Adineta steineri TaxID=433720 RepID=A0A819BLZ8_9BILA|nr:unnamed protein product [Adineta steineri]CAF3796529.1 unnamed protein product [Adineta steineri]
MNAASLGHQYLTAKSFNKTEGYFGGARYRGSKRNPAESLLPKTNDQQRHTSLPASETVADRPTTVSDQVESSEATYERSISDPSALNVTYKPQKGYQPLDEEAETEPEPYALVSILSKRRGSRPGNDRLSSRVRKFYKDQDELIDSLEEIHKHHIDHEPIDDTKLAKQKRHIDWLVKATVVCNCTLLIAKIVAAIFSKSLSIISSVVDSAVDSASACLLLWAVHTIKKRDKYTYPGGRTRLEPIIIVILSVVMISASVQVIYESVETLMNDVKAFKNNGTTGLPNIDMGPVPITVMCVTIVVKATLSFLCFQIANPTMRALANDHLNDVFSNAIALACGIVAAKAVSGTIKAKQVVVVDPSGAIFISLYIIFCWLKQLRSQVRNLSGYAAEPEFLQKITWLTLHHSQLIEKIDTVRAFHFGTQFLVDVEIILPETMSLKQAHDIGASLQESLENLPEVEIAYVHLDYAVDPLKY